MFDLNSGDIEEKAIKHIEEELDDKQLMMHFKDTATGPIRLYVRTMIEEYHKILMEQLR
ncbi:hypothetical protein [Cohnella soli]|uniref:Uncharacterized protein n=1 Tax=Cohnella soli TaxID=425005 RepID=A0ABW0HM58_9BACL